MIENGNINKLNPSFENEKQNILQNSGKINYLQQNPHQILKNQRKFDQNIAKNNKNEENIILLRAEIERISKAYEECYQEKQNQNLSRDLIIKDLEQKLINSYKEFRSDEKNAKTFLFN